MCMSAELHTLFIRDLIRCRGLGSHFFIAVTLLGKASPQRSLVFLPALFDTFGLCDMRPPSNAGGQTKLIKSSMIRLWPPSPKDSIP